MNKTTPPPKYKTKHTGIKHYALLTVGSVLFATGVVIVLTPVPFGTPMVITGSVILIRESTTFRRWLRRRREKNSYVDKFFCILQKKLPPRFTKSLKRTNPEVPPATGDDVKK